MTHEATRRFATRYGLLDSYGLPWTSSIKGCLRAGFPLDETGNAAAGILKLTV